WTGSRRTHHRPACAVRGGPWRRGDNRPVALLHLDDVSAGYGRHTAIEGVTLRVEPGEVVALVGRNGCGKTTILRAAAGVLRPSRGRVEVDGRDLSRLSAREEAECDSGVQHGVSVGLPFLFQ